MQQRQEQQHESKAGPQSRLNTKQATWLRKEINSSINSARLVLGSATRKRKGTEFKQISAKRVDKPKVTSPGTRQASPGVMHTSSRKIKERLKIQKMLDEHHVLMPNDLETLLLLYGPARRLDSSRHERDRVARLVQRCYDMTKVHRGGTMRRDQVAQIKRAAADILQARLAHVFRSHFYTLFLKTYQNAAPTPSRFGTRVRSLGSTHDHSLSRYLNPGAPNYLLESQEKFEYQLRRAKQATYHLQSSSAAKRPRTSPSASLRHAKRANSSCATGARLPRTDLANQILNATSQHQPVVPNAARAKARSQQMWSDLDQANSYDKRHASSTYLDAVSQHSQLHRALYQQQPIAGRDQHHQFTQELVPQIGFPGTSLLERSLGSSQAEDPTSKGSIRAKLQNLLSEIQQDSGSSSKEQKGRRSSEGPPGVGSRPHNDWADAAPQVQRYLNFENRVPLGQQLVANSLPVSPKNMLGRMVAMLRKRIKLRFRDFCAMVREKKQKQKLQHSTAHLARPAPHAPAVRKAWGRKELDRLVGGIRRLWLRRYFAKFAFVIIIMTSLDIGSSLLNRVAASPLRGAFEAIRGAATEHVILERGSTVMDKVAARCAKRVVFTSLANNLRQSVTAQLLRICAVKQIQSTLRLPFARYFNLLARKALPRTERQMNGKRSNSKGISHKNTGQLTPGIPHNTPPTKKQQKVAESPFSPPGPKKYLKQTRGGLDKQQEEVVDPDDVWDQSFEAHQREATGPIPGLGPAGRAGVGVGSAAARPGVKEARVLEKIVQACKAKRKFFIQKGLRRWRRVAEGYKLRLLVLQELLYSGDKIIRGRFERWRRVARLGRLGGLVQGERGVRLAGAVQRALLRAKWQSVQKAWQRWR